MTKENRTKEREIRRYSEALKLQVVKELDEGCLTVREAMEFYDIPWRRTVNYWRQQYGKNRVKTKVVRVLMKSEQHRIRELEKALADKELELLVAKSFISVFEEDYGEEIKKKASPDRLRKLEKLRKQVEPIMKGFAKRSG